MVFFKKVISYLTEAPHRFVLGAFYIVSAIFVFFLIVLENETLLRIVIRAIQIQSLKKKFYPLFLL